MATASTHAEQIFQSCTLVGNLMRTRLSVITLSLLQPPEKNELPYIGYPLTMRLLDLKEGTRLYNSDDLNSKTCLPNFRASNRPEETPSSIS